MIELGVRVRWVFFWGHAAPAVGAIGAHVLSQWSPVEFTVDGVTYRSAERFMMAGKARLFGAADAERAAITAAHPAGAKKAARPVRDFDEATWVGHRLDVVVRANVAKFGQHDDLCSYLLGTGDRVLVEASPRDRSWGIGMGARDEHAEDPSCWRGENLRGFPLMAARAQLRQGRG